MKNLLTALICLPFLLSACVRPQASSVQVLQNTVITEDSVWSGQILIDGKVEVLRNVTLTIAPGTDIAFAYKDIDRDGLGDGTLIVKGRLLAIGTPQQPIRFHSQRSNPQPGDWLEIAVDFSREVHFRYCEIRDSAYTLHAHFTTGIVEDCHIHHNIDGCRIGQAKMELRHNLIEDQSGKGINFRNSRVNVHDNLIRNNVSGLFLFENDQEFSVARNNFENNLHHLRLGDFYTRDVNLEQNWWGAAGLAEIRPLIYDQEMDSAIGRVNISPLKQPVVGAGPRFDFNFIRHWTYQTDAFVDAAPLVVGRLALYPGWDGRLHALNQQGEVAWVADLGDIADSQPASDGQRVSVQTWQRQVIALDLSSGKELWRFEYPESPADDHRQGGLVIANGQLLVPAWNGTLYALAPESGKPLWQYVTDAALRASPLVRGGQIFLPDSSGILHCLSAQGAPLWTRRLGDALLSTPAATKDEGILVVLDKAGTLTAFSLDGQLLWQQELGERCFYAAPVVHGGKVFVGTAGGNVYALQQSNGDVLWRKATGGAVYATPLAYAGRLFVGDNAGHLFALSQAGGDVLATLSLDKPLQSTPVIFADLLLIGSRDRAIHAFKIPF